MAAPNTFCSSTAASATRYRWLLFDADGTLFDYDQAEKLALRQAFERMGVEFQPAWLAIYRRINQTLWQALEQRQIKPDVLKVRRFELLLAAAGVSYPPDSLSAHYLEALGACTVLVEGAQEVLAACQAQYQMAVVTNGLTAVQRSRLSRSALSTYIAELVISEEIGHAKPAPAFFDATFKRLGNPPREQVLMIGDNWAADIQGAAWYGLDTCWYNPGGKPRPPEPQLTHEIKSLRELPPLLAVAAASGS